MAHIFDTSGKNPYVEASKEIESRSFAGDIGIDAGAQDDVTSALTNALVTALGDIAATAYRYGVSEPERIKELAHCVAKSAETILAAYRGEVSPEGALQALEDGDRVQGLTSVNQDKLKREIEKTRQLEHLVLNARRLPDLLDFAGSLDLIVPEEALDQGEILLSADHTPTATRLP